MRVTRMSGIAAAAVAAAVVLGGCTGASGSDDRIVTVNGFEPQNPLIPADAADAGGYRILDQLFAGLAFYDASGALVNDLAERIEPNDDNTVWTVSLQDDARFTDGEPVTAESFVDAWDWAARASNGTINRSLFADIAGYDADADASLIDAGGLTVVDDDTFDIRLSSAVADFSQRLGHVAFAPLPSVFYDDPAAFAEHPVGNGPYQFDGPGAWQRGERLELVRNPGYEGEREPENAGITMRFYDSLDVAYADLISGNLDVIDTLPADAAFRFKDELGSRWVEHPLATLESLTIPSTLAHFAGAEGALRRAAISRAIDREGIAAEVFGAVRVPAHDFTSPALDGWSDAIEGAGVLTYDTDAADDLWAQAEELAPWEGTLELAYNADGGHAEWVEAVAASISRVLEIDVTAVPYPSLGALQEAVTPGPAPSAYRSAWRAAYPGPLAFLLPRFASFGSANTSGYASAAVDAAVREALLATTTAEAEAAAIAAQQTLLADLPTIPLWNGSAQAGYGEGIDDVALDWRGIPLYYLITKRGG